VFCFVAAVWRLLARVEAPADGVANLPSAVLILVNAVLAATMLAAFYGLFLSRLS
jgi:hypothetical protein